MINQSHLLNNEQNPERSPSHFALLSVLGKLAMKIIVILKPAQIKHMSLSGIFKRNKNHYAIDAMNRYPD